jgi:hypothetical protein
VRSTRNPVGQQRSLPESCLACQARAVCGFFLNTEVTEFARSFTEKDLGAPRTPREPSCPLGETPCALVTSVLKEMLRTVAALSVDEDHLRAELPRFRCLIPGSIVS